MKAMTQGVISSLFVAILGFLWTSGATAQGLIAQGGAFAQETIRATPEATPTSMSTTFKVRIENLSSVDGQLASDGSRWPFALSPGLWVVHSRKAPLFSNGKKDRGDGLEAQAEDGNPATLAASLPTRKGVQAVGIFNTPIGASVPGPAGPGNAFEFTFEADPGARLSFSTMFGQSNDLFYAPDEEGIALYDAKGQPVQGDITAQLILWDAGTEVNQEPGIGPDQAPRQASANTGAAEQSNVRRVHDGFVYPRNADVFRVTLSLVALGAR